MPCTTDARSRRAASLLRRSALLLLTAAVALFAVVAVASAAKVHRATVGVHYAKVVPTCATPAPGHARCLSLRRVPATAKTRGAHRYVVRASYVAGKAGGYTPGDLLTAYGLGSLASLTATGAPGTGQTVAIVDAYDDPKAEADLGMFDTTYGLPACTTANGCFQKVGQTGTPALPASNDMWAAEIALDVQAVHAVCPRCKILLVEANSDAPADLAAATNTAVSMGADEVSNSYGVAENNDPTFAAAYVHPGVVITAGTGDNGYFNWTKPSLGTSADLPAAYPGVIAVGGTNLQLNLSNRRTAETVWNDNTGPQQAGGDSGATGGGCSALFTAPAWQAAVPGYSTAGCSGKRLDADISAIGDPYTGFDVYNSQGASAPGWATIGGTSLSTPVIAAMYALAGGAQGDSNPGQTLYAGLTNSPSSLFDVTVGGNGFCYGATPGNCAGAHTAESDCGGTTACAAAPGYDGPSGIGTPNGLGAFSTVSPSFTVTGRALPATSVPFDASASTSSGGAITSYTWYWGDGTAPTTVTTPTTTHTFASTGRFAVSLVASTGSGRKGGPVARWIDVANPCSTSCSWIPTASQNSLVWSDPGNWTSGNTPDTGTNGALVLPGGSCAVATECTSNNDVTGASFTSAKVDTRTNYRVTGNTVTLGSGGLSTTSDGLTYTEASWDLPTALGAPQTWSLPNNNSTLRVFQPVTGSANALTLSVASGGQLFVDADAETGPLTVSGGGSVFLADNALHATQHGGLNGSNGHAVTVTGAKLEATTNAGVGPLSADGIIAVSGRSYPTLTVNGAATFGGTAEYRPGLDDLGAAKLVATGAVTLGGSLTLLESLDGVCNDVTFGKSFTLLQGSSVSGTFANAPEGSTVSVQCQTSGAFRGSLQIHYTGTSVVGTAVHTTTTTLTQSTSSPKTNQSVTLTATITSTAGTPTGTVAFFDGGSPISACTAQTVNGSGVATCTVKYAPSDFTRTLTAAYTPLITSSFGGSRTPTNPPLTLLAVKDTPTVSVGVSSSAPDPNQNVTFTATVTPSFSGATVPTGDVVFRDGSTDLCTAPLAPATNSSNASCARSFTTPGAHNITASYFAGDFNFTAATTASATVVTVSQGPGTTTILAAPSPSSVVTNQSVTLMATVTGHNGTPVGTVTFTKNNTPLPDCVARTVDGSGVALCTTSFVASQFSPNVSLGASYTPGQGSLNTASATAAPTTLAVAADATTTTLTASSTAPAAGQSVTYTATVTPAHAGAALPTGSVAFKDNGSFVCSGSIAAGTSTTTCDSGLLFPGAHSITAEYHYDGGFLASTSVAVTVTATAAGTTGGGTTGGGTTGGTTGGGSPAPSSPLTPPVTVTPTPAAPSTPVVSPLVVRAALAAVLAPTGATAKLAAIVKAGGYLFAFKAPSAGKLTITWYATVGKKRTLVGAGSASFAAAGAIKVKVKLNGAGKAQFRKARQVKLTSVSTFTPAGAAAVQSTKASTLKA